MGIDAQALRFLLTAKQSGVSFESTMMIGRQNFTALPSKHAARTFCAFGLTVGDDTLQATDAEGYIEPMLTSLGALHIDSVDYSPFEGASVIHDMNVPISDELKGRYSVVIDSGTLEHIFNYPQALKNAMEMVAVGGHFLAITPCNNSMGHGFYQFSPELFFRAFSEKNGFTVEHMFICQWGQGPWYRVSDPSVIGQRVELVNDHTTYLLIQAARVHETNIFAAAPQQSDYVTKWNGETSHPSTPVPNPALSFVKRLVPGFVMRTIARWQGDAHCKKITNRVAFQPVDSD